MKLFIHVHGKKIKIMDDKKLIKKWQKDIEKSLVGRRIVGVEYLTDKEMEANLWYKRPIVLILDDGNWLIPMADDEGNDGGAIATSYEKLRTIPVI